MISLIVPGSSERMLAKAREIDVDELVIDLEDAVVPERKPEALQLTIAAIEHGFAASRVSVRVNPPRSPWAHLELIALGSARVRPQTVVVPKTQRSGDLAFVERLLDGVEASSAFFCEPIGVQALIESAEGIANLDAITHGTPRLEAVIIGYADLAVSLGRSDAGASDLDRWGPLQDALIIAARSRGLQAIDGPFLSIDDRAGLNASAARAAELGFDGKWAIHPAQIDPIRTAFTPSSDAVAYARTVIATLAGAEADGAGAISLDGKMLDEAVRLAALRTLRRAGVLDEEPVR
jgi:citrate lyase subunit beta / citryl-CoA lyase